MLQRTRILLWRACALIALAVGLLALAVPVLPTTPFLIVAAWAGGKGWPALERWLIGHPTYGPHIRAWRERGAVSRPAKAIAITMMLLSAVGMQYTSLPPWIRGSAPILILMVAIWLWRTPDA